MLPPLPGRSRERRPGRNPSPRSSAPSLVLPPLAAAPACWRAKPDQLGRRGLFLPRAVLDGAGHPCWVAAQRWLRARRREWLGRAGGVPCSRRRQHLGATQICRGCGLGALAPCGGGALAPRRWWPAPVAALAAVLPGGGGPAGPRPIRRWQVPRTALSGDVGYHGVVVAHGGGQDRLTAAAGLLRRRPVGERPMKSFNPSS